MPFINYKHKHFRMRQSEPDLAWHLELQTNFNACPLTSKTSTTYIPVDCPGFVQAVLMWVKRNQEFAGMEMADFIDSLLTPNELAQLDGMPLATNTTREMPDK